MRDLSDAHNIAEVRAALAELRTRHASVTTKLETSIAQHEELSRHLRRLDLSRARLGTLASNARNISHGTLAGAASTAGKISESVEQLDLEQARVKDTLAVVEQVSELKACILGVVGSMGAPQDWEAAAEYINRASHVPKDVIDSGFAEAVVPTAEVPDPPSVTLDNAAQSLCQLFLREFDKAVEEGDGAKITRFFKMFPLIGRSREGLNAYGRYVCQGVAIRARARLQAPLGSGSKDGFFYVNALTKLFEHIAQVIDGHSPLVERHYGAGTMVKVMERLHSEADVQGGIILDTWSEERSVDRKLTDAKSYAFSFLVQSFMGVQKTNVPSRTQSPAVGASVNGAHSHEEEGVDMREVDQILNEIGAMLGRWSLYLRFVSSRAIQGDNDHDDRSPTTSPPSLTPAPFVLDSNLPKKVSKLLLDPFKTFATFFLRRSVEKAFQLDEFPSGLTLDLNRSLDAANPPFITSAVDDVMYVVNQNLQRALATSQAEIVVSLASTTARVLGSDFIGMVQRKMRDESYPKAVIPGAPPPEDKVISFLVLLNDLDLAIDYIKRIVRAHADVDLPSNNHKNKHAQNGSRDPDEENGPVTHAGAQLGNLFPMGRDARHVRNALRSLEAGFIAKATELNADGIAVLYGQVVKPRVRPILADALRDAEYTSSSSFADGDGHADSNGGNDHLDAMDDDSANSTVRARLATGWDALTRPLKRILSDRNNDRLMTTVASALANLLEKRIWSYHGRVTELGAVALERDVVDIVNVVVKGQKFALREHFARCLQVVMIMNLEDEEWDELVRADEGEGERTWVLDGNERVRARTLVRGRV